MKHMNKKFGNLTAVEFVGRNHNGDGLYRCLCSCGNECTIPGNSLQSGKTKSCGCLKKRRHSKFESYIGQTINQWTIIGMVTDEKYYKRFQAICSCGKVGTPSAAMVVNGKSKSCGCSLKEHLPEETKHLNLDKYGYVRISINGKRVKEHRYVVEQAYGEKLKSHESIHHKNGIRHDNRLENLEVWSKKQPSGQRVEDKIKFCIEFLEEYNYKVSI